MTQLGPYQLVRRLGAGGSAEVFLARGPNPRGAEHVALKLILPHLAEDGGHRAMLLREARLVAPLRHPNVVELYEVGEVDGRTFLAMEYVAGGPLNVLMRRMRDAGQRLSLSEACHLVREAALGLHHAHEARGDDGQLLGLVHRDVSPHNLMVSSDGHVKVVDFGLARATHAGATMTGGLKGKLRYMPPEQLRSQPLDRRTDVFALGAVLWDLALGAPLYPGPTEADIFQQALFAPQPHPDEVARGLPRAFVEVLIRAVERDAARRIATAQDLADALTPFIQPDAAAAVTTRVSAIRAAAEELASAGKRLSTVSENPAPVEPRPPAPPSPIHTPQEARLAPALASMPRVRKGAVAPRESAARPREKHTPPRGADLRDTLPSVSPPKPEASAPKANARASDDELSEVSITAADALPRRSRRALLTRVIAVVAIAGCAGAGIALIARGLTTQPASEPTAAATEAAAGAAASPDPAAGSVPDAVAPSAPQSAERRPDREETGRRAQGTLVLKSDRPALVRTAGGRDLGMTPLTVRLSAGRHRLELKSVDGTATRTLTVEIPRNQVIEQRVVMAP